MAEPQEHGSADRNGLAGALKLIAVVAVLLLALLAAGFVLDLVPKEAMGEIATKVVLLAAIVAITAFLIGALIGRSKR
jgi:hypothetical protein